MKIFEKLLLLSLIFMTSVVIVGSKRRTIGGLEVFNFGEIPYIVSIRQTHDSTHYCGGAIISDDFVLTAAHCTCGPSAIPVSKLYIYAGSAFLTLGGVNYSTERSICHPEYDYDAYTGDIALIQIKSRFDFTGNDAIMRPIEISTDEVPVGTKVMVAGWGYIDSHVGENFKVTFVSTNLLMKTFVNVTDRKECNEYYETFQQHISNNQICTHEPYKTGICSGDSGGPLVYNKKLIGIVSYTVPCDQMFPDVHTRVGAYIDWIKKNVPSLRNRQVRQNRQK